MSGVTRRSICLGLATAFLKPLHALAQDPPAPRPFCRVSIGGGWSDAAPAEYITHRARPNDPSGVPQAVASIKRSIGIDAEIEIYIAEAEDNAFATVAGNRKILVIDVGFLEKLNRLTRTGWSGIQVIAHEVGHHIAGFTADRHRGELNADYWSGQCLQRLGSARDAATACILRVGTDFDTPSHPNKQRRARTIVRGWDDASHGRIDYSFCDGCEP